MKFHEEVTIEYGESFYIANVQIRMRDPNQIGLPHGKKDVYNGFLILLTAKNTHHAVKKLIGTDYSIIEDGIDPSCDISVDEIYLASDIVARALQKRSMIKVRHIITLNESGNLVLSKCDIDTTNLQANSPLKIWHIVASSKGKPFVDQIWLPLKRTLNNSIKVYPFITPTENALRLDLMTDQYQRMACAIFDDGSLELYGHVKIGERVAFVFYDMTVHDIADALAEIYYKHSNQIEDSKSCSFYCASSKSPDVYKIICDETLKLIPVDPVKL